VTVTVTMTVTVTVTMTMANMDRLCRSYNRALEVGKGLGVALTTATVTTIISSSVGALPYGSY
jgi:hypothetical protein